MIFKKNFNREKNIESIDMIEKSIIEKLDSLGINYKHLKNKDGKLIYRFFNVKELGRGIFHLDAKDKNIIYHAFHFGKGKFKHPENKNAKNNISSDKILKYLKEKFSDADEFVLSCCYPDKARKKFEETSNKPIILGSGDSEYNTIHNSKKHFITLSPHDKLKKF